MIRETLVTCALSVQVMSTTAIAQPSLARAEISDGVVKIGVPNDMSSHCVWSAKPLSAFQTTRTRDSIE
jgi:hypothetical protein